MIVDDLVPDVQPDCFVDVADAMKLPGNGKMIHGTFGKFSIHDFEKWTEDQDGS